MNKELVIREVIPNTEAIHFCDLFENSDLPKYILGRNEYAKSVMRHIEVSGIIDDFTKEKEFNGKPIVKLENISSDSLVLIASLCKPLTAEKRVAKYQFRYLSYYSFYKNSSAKELLNIDFWGDTKKELIEKKQKYNEIYRKLNDAESKNQFFNIINFRQSYNLEYMRGFKDKENLQYFEEFLKLNKEDEVFLDIGGFDGYTTKEFIRYCPNYKAVHFFEPNEENLSKSKERLKNSRNINFYQVGLSSKKQELSFENSGSSSKISTNGQEKIFVDKLDNLNIKDITFIKMDIEGAELDALEGAKETILKYHPKLAICVYHKPDDLWKIPEQILSIRNDYNIYLRHYSEGFTETVMFFIPI